MTAVAFFGTPDEAVPILERLAQIADVRLVVTQPDRARGRSKRLRPPPVKVAASELGIEVRQPAKAAAALAEAAAVRPDIAVVAAYGRLIRPELLALPRLGFVNVHFSLLPRWRGASPVVRAILAGDEITGVTIMQMDEGLDTGPILATRATPIGTDESAGGLTDRLARLGADLLEDVFDDIVNEKLVPSPQPLDGVTGAAKVRRDEAFIDPSRHGSASVLRAVRAFNPRPGAWGILDGERFKVWEASPAEVSLDPGVVSLVDGLVVVGTVDGSVALELIQPVGKPRMAAEAWMRGYRGDGRFGSATR